MLCNSLSPRRRSGERARERGNLNSLSGLLSPALSSSEEEREQAGVASIAVSGCARSRQPRACRLAQILDNQSMSKVEQLQSEIGKLSARGMQELRDWLENVLEDQLELREEFKSKIERDMAEGRDLLAVP